MAGRPTGSAAPLIPRPQRPVMAGGAATAVPSRCALRIIHIAEIKPSRNRLSAGERPARPVPSRIRADTRFDLRVGHAYIIVPRPVVNPNVIQAKPIKFTQMVARFERETGVAGEGEGLVLASRGPASFFKVNQYHKSDPTPHWENPKMGNLLLEQLLGRLLRQVTFGRWDNCWDKSVFRFSQILESEFSQQLSHLVSGSLPN